MKEEYCTNIRNHIIKTLKTVELPHKIKNIYLIGSTAKNYCTEKSDVDILIEFKSLDILDIENSSLFKLNKQAVNNLERNIQDTIGLNPITGDKFDLQLVGAYELRFFPEEEINDINNIKIKINQPHVSISKLIMMMDVFATTQKK